MAAARGLVGDQGFAARQPLRCGFPHGNPAESRQRVTGSRGQGIRRVGLRPGRYTPRLDRTAQTPAMHTKIRKSSAKHKKKTGYITRQQTKGGRKTNRRQRRRHGSF